jgi:Rrf2 family protein
MSGLFKVSVREHSAMLLMSALGRVGEGYTSLQEVADSLHISQGYLEEIAASLKKAGLIQGRQGPGGGYRLAKPASGISLEEILTATEGPLALVDCQSGIPCPVESSCSSKTVWRVVQKSLQDTLRNTTLAETL